jgi:hypothetical protein
MYTDDGEVDAAVDDPAAEAVEEEPSVTTVGLPFLPLTGVVAPLSSFEEEALPAVPLCDKLDGMIIGSSNCPAGVSSKAPSGLNVNLLKKLVKLSSPYSLTFAHWI